MTDDDFKLGPDGDLNKVIDAVRDGMASTIGGEISHIKCKGIRIYFVDNDSGMLMSSGLFVKDFSPEDWER